LKHRREFRDFLTTVNEEGEYNTDFLFPAESYYALLKLDPEIMSRAKMPGSE